MLRIVRAKGLEPPRLPAPDPKSGLATNYNTPAEKECKDMEIFFNTDNFPLIIFS